MSIDIEITAQTRVGDLLAHPELERELLAFTPTFEKLKNPILRRTVAKVATLRQAAEVAGVEVSQLVAALRRAAGQGPAPGEAGLESEQEDQVEPPSWVDAGRVVLEIDAEEALDRGEHPLAVVQRRLRTLERGDIIRVEAAFKPAPLIDTLRGQGLAVYAGRAEQGSWHIWIGQVTSEPDRRSP